MDNLRNSLVLLQPTPADAKLFGWYVSGGNVVIETIAQYLARVPIKHRSPDAPVTMQLPKAGYTSLGTYTVAEFKGGILANFEGHYYTFVGGLEDENFVEIPGPHLPVTINPGSAAFASIDENQVLTINEQSGSLVFEDTEDVVWDIDTVAKTIKANTVGFTGTFLDQGGDVITVLRGLIKTKNNSDGEGLSLTFDYIVNVPVADPASVSDWNVFFDLPVNGTPFGSVVVIGNVVNLIGGSGITIKKQLFGYNSNLLSIIDNVNCVSIVDSAFNACNNLTTAKLPACTIIKGFVDLWIGGFSRCSSLINVRFPALGSCELLAFYNCTSLINPSFPLLTSIGNSCFDGCTNLVSPSFPSLTSIGEAGFLNCVNLNTDFSNVTLMDRWSFMGCTSLVSDFPLVTDVPFWCFFGCSSLTNPDFSSVSSIGNSAFANCLSLVSLNCPNLLTIIEYASFEACNSLNSLYFPSLLNLGTTVGTDNVFNLVTGITLTLTIPATLMTCNSGAPDGDIQYLQANNTVTIVTV